MALDKKLNKEWDNRKGSKRHKTRFCLKIGLELTWQRNICRESKNEYNGRDIQ